MLCSSKGTGGIVINDTIILWLNVELSERFFRQVADSSCCVNASSCVVFAWLTAHPVHLREDRVSCMQTPEDGYVPDFVHVQSSSCPPWHID